MNADSAVLRDEGKLKGSLRKLARSYPILSRTFGALRHQVTKGSLREYYHMISAGHVARHFAVQRFLRHDGPKYLQVGGGYHVKKGADWLNADIIAGDIYSNATKRLPLPDESIDMIFTEQFIEHLPPAGGRGFLKEAFRVLKPGGVIRQSTPDMRRLVTIYLDQSNSVERQTVVDRHIRVHRPNDQLILRNGCQYLNDQMRLWGHQYVYDEETLRALTESIGFTNFRWVSFGHSERPELSNLERHADSDWMKTEISMFCEAEKPASGDAAAPRGQGDTPSGS